MAPERKLFLLKGAEEQLFKGCYIAFFLLFIEGISMFSQRAVGISSFVNIAFANGS